VEELNATLNLSLHKLSNMTSTLSSLEYNVDSAITVRRNIGSRLHSSSHSLSELETRLRELQSFITVTVERYTIAENQLIHQASILSESQTLTYSEPGPHANGKDWNTHELYVNPKAIPALTGEQLLPVNPDSIPGDYILNRKDPKVMEALLQTAFGRMSETEQNKIINRVESDEKAYQQELNAFMRHGIGGMNPYAKDALDIVSNFIVNAANSVAFGIPDAITGHPIVNRADYEQWGSGAGKFAGNLIGVGKFYKLTKPLVNGIGNHFVKTFAQGAIAGELFGGTKEALDVQLDVYNDGEQSPIDRIFRVEETAVIYGGTDAGFVLLGKVLKPLLARYVKPRIAVDAQGTGETTVPNIAPGASRANKFSNGWGNGSLRNTVDNVAPDAVPYDTPSGKTIYSNDQTGKQVVYDKAGNYYRVEDTNINGKRRYVGTDGTDVSKKMVNEVQWDLSKDEYQQATHFNNTDK
jgi:hypothetical protein